MNSRLYVQYQAIISLMRNRDPEAEMPMLFMAGVVLVLPESAEKLVASIVQLCEAWWNKQLDGCRDLVGQTLLYLVQMSLQKTNVSR